MLKPKVSVCVITYNHESYIRRCLQSILDQGTDFDFEVVVGDDCSIDGTKAIIREFYENHPKKIRPIYHEENIGGNANLVSVYKAAAGKYIAHVDGDDCMEPGKLQRQFDALEQHPDCSLCTHDMKVINENSELLSNSFHRHQSGKFSLMDLYEKLPFFAHSSKMFSNELSFIKNLTKNTVDIEIHVEQARYRGIYHIDEPLGCYRVGTGVTNFGGRVNPLLPAATRRVYSAALSDVNVSIFDREKIKKYFSKSILNYAYQSALIGNSRDCRMYALESMRIKILSLTQFALLLASFLPVGLRILARARPGRY